MGDSAIFWYFSGISDYNLNTEYKVLKDVDVNVINVPRYLCFLQSVFSGIKLAAVLAAVAADADMSFKRNSAETIVKPSPCFDNRTEEFQSNLSKVQ